MAIPTDYIFTRGQVVKSGVFDLIVNSLIAAGWTNVSSLATSDFVVLKSTGNTEDKSLILNIRDTNASNTNSIKTTNYNTMSYRLQTSYTPGAAGVAGTFGRPAMAWTAMDIVPTVAATGTLPMDTMLTYSIYADKSKFILALEYPYASGYGPLVIYMGLPDSLYCLEEGNSGTLAATTVNVTGNTVYICNTPAGLGNVTDKYSLTVYGTLSPKNPNNAGKYALSHLYYGSTTEGPRGKLDGIYVMPQGNVVTGDIITLGTKKYYVLVCHIQGANSFLSPVLAIRTE